jgi:hypothetical protein
MDGYLGATDQMDQFTEGQIVILGLLIIMPTFLAGNICYVLLDSHGGEKRPCH